MKTASQACPPSSLNPLRGLADLALSQRPCDTSLALLDKPAEACEQACGVCVRTIQLNIAKLESLLERLDILVSDAELEVDDELEDAEPEDHTIV